MFVVILKVKLNMVFQMENDDFKVKCDYVVVGGGIAGREMRVVGLFYYFFLEERLECFFC